MRVEAKISDKNLMIGRNILVANTFYQRLKGLMFSKEMRDFDGLIINPCNSIHTFFMCYNIDVLFLDKEYKIIKIIRDLTPWKMTLVYFKASQVLELYGGTLSPDVHEGERLEVLCLS